MGCDGEEALNKAMDWHSRVNAESPHADIILAIRSKVQATNITWYYKHVKGYRDDYRDYGSLDRMSQLRVLMDGSAKAYLPARHTRQHNQQQQSITGEPWSLWISRKKIVRELKSRTTPKKWWMRKGRFTEDTIDTVDSTATGRAMKSAELNRQQWITKHTSGICRVGTMVVKWKLRRTPACPRCGQDEDAAHV